MELAENVRPMGLNVEYVGRFLRKLAMMKQKFAPEITNDLAECWLEMLDGYSLSELGRAYKEIVDQVSGFPDVSEVKAVMDRNRYGNMAEQRFAELIELVESYKANQQRTCDEILGRVVEEFGGLDKISKYWPGAWHLRKREFCETFNKVFRDYNEGVYSGQPLPSVGNRISIPVGSDPVLLLPPPPKEKEEHESSNPTRINLRSFLTGKGSPQNKPEPEEITRIAFFDRLYQIAQENGIWQGEKPQLSSVIDRCLNDVERQALEICIEKNKNLNNFSVHNSKGWMVQYNDTSLMFKFSPQDDPLHDGNPSSFLTPEMVEEQQLSRKTPEEREVWKRNKANKTATF